MRLQKIAIALLILLILASGIHFARRSGTDPQAYSNDFNVYYFAARELIDGRDPYQNSLGAWTPYLYPPLFAETLILLALLPLPIAAYLWFLISTSSVLATLWMLVILASSEENEEKNSSYHKLAIAVISLIVLIRFILDNLDMGQVNNAVMALSVAHIYFHSKNKKLASSISLALAVSIKLTPALLVVYSLARREWRFATQCVVMSAILMALSFVPFGSRAPDAFSRFANRTIQNEQGFDLAYPGNQSVRGFLSRMNETKDEEPFQSTRKPTDTLALILSFVLLVAAVVAAAIARNALAAAAPIFCCAILLSPLAWKAHFVMLLLPVVSMAKESLIKKRYLTICALVAAFCMFNLTSPRIVGVSAAEWADSHSLVFAGAVLIFFISVVIAMSNNKSYIADH
jgi:alpha-1,2-mannosyltransferase